MGTSMSVLSVEKETNDSAPSTRPRRPAGAGRGERISLLETIVIFSISAAIIIFVFAMSAAALGDHQFRLPAFLTDSVKTLWSLVAAGGVAVVGSGLDLALRRQPRSINYITYILATTGLLFAPIVGLLVYGKSAQSLWPVPAGATPINIIDESVSKQSFALANLTGPSPVGFYLSGEVTVKNGHLSGTANGTITKNNSFIPVPMNFTASQVVLHLCYYQKQSASPLVSVAIAPKFPQVSNVGIVKVPIPMTTDAITISPFPFDIEIPVIAHPNPQGQALPLACSPTVKA